MSDTVLCRMPSEASALAALGSSSAPAELTCLELCHCQLDLLPSGYTGTAQGSSQAP